MLMNPRDIFRQSLPLLLICGMGEITTGTLLSTMVDLLENNPGLMVLVPASLGMRGNISNALGARLGSATHMGLIDRKDFWNREMRNNLKAAMILNIVISALIGVLAHVSCSIAGADSIGLVRLTLIAVTAGTVAGLVLTFLTAGIVNIAFRRGYDPDNVTGPSLATIGDIITLFSLFGAAHLLGGG